MSFGSVDDMEEFDFGQEHEIDAQTIDLGDNEEDIDIEIVDDRPVEDQVESDPNLMDVDTDEPLEGVSKKVEQRFAVFTKQKHQLRRQAEEAERQRLAMEQYARSQQARVSELENTLKAAEPAYIAEIKSRLQMQQEASEKSLTDAFDQGDSIGVAKAAATIAEAAAAAERVKNYQPQYQEPRQPGPEPQPQYDAAVVERHGKWRTDNDWYGVDPEMTSDTDYFANKAQAQGFVFGTEPFYAEVDRNMKVIHPDKFKKDQPGSDLSAGQPVESRRRTPTVVSPGNRESGQSRTKVTLSPSELVAAKKLGVSKTEYARQKLMLQRKGEE